MQTSNLLIEASDLQRFYGNHVAVDSVSLNLKSGEVLGLLGPNGAGKSTILQMLSGTLAPHAGTIHINGIDLKEHPTDARRQIGYLPETPPLYKDMTIREYLNYCGKLHGLKGSQLKSAVESAIDDCQLGELQKRLIANLSKGYQQRTGIAQAILHRPALIILDEPTVGLDPLQLEQIRNLVRELGKQHGVILSTHILQEVDAVCERVQIINKGKTVLNESLDSLNAREQSLEDFFNQQLKNNVEADHA
ncbi:ATP-binding cassette domain-containing protein [Leucothrix sargassi]|nr:ATP-binding cassette domain-containing protein [Leucothrix sargassi]